MINQNNQKSVTKTSSSKNNLRIKVLLDKLRAKLKDFTVLDRQELVMGRVKDVNLDTEGQLNLVVSDEPVDNYSHLFLLRSSYIQQVNYLNRSLSVDLSKSNASGFPEFKLPEHPGVELSTLPPPPSVAAPEVVDQNYNNVDSLPSVAESADTQEEYEDEDSLDSSEIPEVVEEEVIRLLEERLVIDTTKRKVGEVIVRKEVETRMVEVPVQYEKLIIEQISPERKQLAEIELGHEEIPGIEHTEITPHNTEIAAKDTKLTISGEFSSPRAVSLLLDAIAMQQHHGCKKLRLEIVLEDAEHLETYQKWFERCSS